MTRGAHRTLIDDMSNIVNVNKEISVGNMMGCFIQTVERTNKVTDAKSTVGIVSLRSTIEPSGQAAKFKRRLGNKKKRHLGN